jgi:glycosyltransferase involved in cell wall biosynthesis
LPSALPVFASSSAGSFEEMAMSPIGQKAGASIAVSTPDNLAEDFFIDVFRAGFYTRIVTHAHDFLSSIAREYRLLRIRTITAYHSVRLILTPASGILNVLYMNARENALKSIRNNIQAVAGLFWNPIYASEAWKKHKLRILIFNWRDTRHIYTGGAEVYVQQLGKRWVKDGNTVTLFCGNDHRNPANEVIDGVQIVRRGGTYTVYLFAFIYYILKFRGKYDLIIDCENGIPFFTPFYVGKPVILVIHHVHQEVFQSFLSFPFNHIAAFLEGKIMPLIYMNRSIITVSESSKRDIIALGFTKPSRIEIIYNGIDDKAAGIYPKTEHPSFLYLGRLKAYKNIDIAIRAFARIVKTQKDATLTIAGYGEMYPQLTELVLKLGIDRNVNFLGFVTEAKKYKLLSESWVLLQPSLIEGWGITVIEANAQGTPVIASRVAGLCDSVVDGKTGLLVTPGNITEFSAAMETLINNREVLISLSNSAYEWSKNFGWDKSAQSFYMIIGKSFGVVLPELSYAELFAATPE